MAGSITLTNLGGYSLGIANDETAINVQKLSVKADTKKTMVQDKIGHQVGRVDNELHQEYNIEGFVTGTTGIMAATEQIGILITLANVISFGGVSAGSTLLDDAQVNYESAVLAKVNYKATRYPDIPGTATQTTI